MKRRNRFLLILMALLVCGCVVAAWSATAAMGGDAQGAAGERIRGKIEAGGLTVDEIRIEADTVTVALGTSDMDRAKPNTGSLLGVFRAASEENARWLEYSVDGNQSVRMQLDPLDRRAHLAAADAETQIAEWIDSVAMENNVRIEETRLADYRLDLTVSGDMAALEAFADMSTNGGVPRHEQGAIDYLHLEALLDGQLVYQADYDYELGIRVQWRGPGFEGQF